MRSAGLYLSGEVRNLPTDRGHMFVLRAGDERASMQVGQIHGRSHRRLPRPLQPAGHSRLAPPLADRARADNPRRREHVKVRATPLIAAGALGLGASRAYRLLASGAVTLDLGVGRRVQLLGPLVQMVQAPPEVVFDVIAAPYLGRTPRALADKLEVWERGSDMALAAHFTQVKCGTTTTLETVRFERPDRIDFRLVRGPVPHLAESFLLTPEGAGSELRWQGELGTDFWAVGAWWGRRVAHAWTRAVDASFHDIAAEAERRAARMSRSS